MRNKIDWNKWQKRLDEAFNEDGLTGGKLLKVIKAEEEFISYLNNNYDIYLRLTSCFLSFFMQTLEIAEKQKNSQKHKKGMWYLPLLLDQATTFRTFRAAENLLYKGYPLTGYAILRELKDRAIIYGAIANNITNYKKAWGIEGLDIQDHQNWSETKWEKVQSDIKTNRKKEESRIFRQMLGSNSGIPKKYQKELISWIEMFHLEVHGGRLSYVSQGLDWLKGQSKIPIVPEPDSNSESTFMWTSTKIGWMLLRTLNLLQLEPEAYGKEWCRKWHILDESYSVMMDYLKDNRHDLASAIKYLLEIKFDFAPEKTQYNG